MTEGYAKRKRTVIREFHVGEKVNLKIPTNDKENLTIQQNRMPCFVVSKTKEDLYKLEALPGVLGDSMCMYIYACAFIFPFSYLF